MRRTDRCRLCSEQDQVVANEIRRAARKARERWPDVVGDFVGEHLDAAARRHARGEYSPRDGADFELVQQILAFAEANP